MSDETNLRIAAWLGYRPARERLGADAPPGVSVDWLAQSLVPYVTYNRFQEAGLFPASPCPEAWTRETRQRAVLAWARALLEAFEVAFPGDDGARHRIDAATRYLLDPRPENDISLGLLFSDGPKHPGYEVAGLACRAVADPSEKDLPSIFGQAIKRAALALSSDPSAKWFQADLRGALWILRAELVPWGMGLADPLVDGDEVGEALVADQALWEPIPGSDWNRLLATGA